MKRLFNYLKNNIGNIICILGIIASIVLFVYHLINIPVLVFTVLYWLKQIESSNKIVKHIVI